VPHGLAGACHIGGDPCHPRRSCWPLRKGGKTSAQPPTHSGRVERLSAHRRLWNPLASAHLAVHAKEKEPGGCVEPESKQHMCRCIVNRIFSFLHAIVPSWCTGHISER